MSSKQRPVAVIGAGIAGLTAAHFLRRNGVPVIVLEGGKHIAGFARSYVDDRGFHYDFGAHFITNRLAAAIGVGAQCRDVAYYGESVLVNGRTHSYPFGLMAVPRFALGGAKAKMGGLFNGKPVETAEDWARAEYGNALAEEVSMPILEAWSGASASQLSAAVGQKIQNSIGKTAYLKLYSRLRGRAISIGYSQEMPEGPNVWHVYPEGGVSLLCERLAVDLADVIELESPVEQILVEDDRVASITAGGREREVAAVVSTVPLPFLPKLVAGTDALAPLARFKFRPMLFVCLRFETRGILSDTVLWTAGCGLPFFRLTETPLSMPWLAPEGKTLITADIGCQVGDDVWKTDDEVLGERCVDALATMFPRIRETYSGCRVLRTPIAYPIYLNEYEADRRRFAAGLGVDGLYSIGRNGEFAHILMEDVYWRTLKKMNGLIGELPKQAAVDESEVPTTLEASGR